MIVIVFCNTVYANALSRKKNGDDNDSFHTSRERDAYKDE